MLEEALKQKIIAAGMINPGEGLLLGVSGGPDSMALLELFCALKKELRLKLVALHFNHALRAEADDEEAFAARACRKHGIKFIGEKKEVKKFFDGDSLEQTARFLRYDFFLKCSRETGIKKLALAHHKDDLAETVLLRIIRGAGLRGLRGFLPVSKYKRLTVVRPLIDTRKTVILDWLKAKKISYCVDQSNLSDEFLRNRVRNELMPLLEKINPAITDNLANLARTAAVDYEFIGRAAGQVLQKLKRAAPPARVELDIQGLAALEKALFNNVVRAAVEEAKGNTRRLEMRHIDEIASLVRARKNGSIVDLPGLSVRKTATRLIFAARV